MTAIARIKTALKRAGDEAFDRYLGVDTAGDVLPGELGFDPADDNRHYQATNWLASLWLHALLRRMQPTASDAFLDYGAGKGRVVLQAAAFPFGKVVGVELSPSLAGVARANVERNRHRLVSRDVTIAEADMGEFGVPDDVSVVYMYNPSEGPAFVAALERLRESLQRRPRSFRLIYVNARMHRHLVAAGFRVAHDLPLVDWRVYAYGPR